MDGSQFGKQLRIFRQCLQRLLKMPAGCAGVTSLVVDGGHESMRVRMVGRELQRPFEPPARCRQRALEMQRQAGVNQSLDVVRVLGEQRFQIIQRPDYIVKVQARQGQIQAQLLGAGKQRQRALVGLAGTFEIAPGTPGVRQGLPARGMFRDIGNQALQQGQRLAVFAKVVTRAGKMKDGVRAVRRQIKRHLAMSGGGRISSGQMVGEAKIDRIVRIMDQVACLVDPTLYEQIVAQHRAFLWAVDVLSEQRLCCIRSAGSKELAGALRDRAGFAVAYVSIIAHGQYCNRRDRPR